MKTTRTKFMLCLALALGVLALSAGSAFADGTPPTGPSAPSGAIAPRTFTCDAANARLARVNGLVARIQARIASGHVKDAAKAAARLQNAQNRAARIQARIAIRC